MVGGNEDDKPSAIPTTTFDLRLHDERHGQQLKPRILLVRRARRMDQQRHSFLMRVNNLRNDNLTNETPSLAAEVFDDSESDSVNMLRDLDARVAMG
jgi:hypothetical protein